MKKQKRSRFVSEPEDIVCTGIHMDKETWDLLPLESRQRMEAMGWRDGINPNPEYPADFVKKIVQTKTSLEKFEWDILPEEIKKDLESFGYKDGICPRKPYIPEFKFNDQKSKKKK